MIIIFNSIVLILLTALVLYGVEYKANDKISSKNPLVIFDMDKWQTVNNLGDAYGAFDANPNDKESSIRLTLKKDKDLHKKGYYFKVTYDVESSQVSYNGVWTKLRTLDLSKFKAVALTIRGDKEKGFSEIFKIEIKDKKTKIEGYIEDISDKWKKCILSFEDFQGPVEDLDYKNIKEFVFVFEDRVMTKKTGRYYIDDIIFIPKKGAVVKYSDIVK